MHTGVYDELSPDDEAWDSSSIASSRPGSPLPLVEDLDLDQAPYAESSGASCLQKRNGEGEKNNHFDKMESRIADALEQELEPVPGLLSGRKSSFSSPVTKTHESARPSKIAVNGAAALTSKRDAALSKSESTDMIVEGATSNVRQGSIVTAHVDAGIAGITDSPRLVSHPLYIPRISSPTQPLCRLKSAQASIDSTHVRPSLNMTAQEFSEAKAIILDLLGWGVPAEYLINCGLARESIYYAFTELNLRLPSNFDVNGIIPYEPPPI